MLAWKMPHLSSICRQFQAPTYCEDRFVFDILHSVCRTSGAHGYSRRPVTLRRGELCAGDAKQQNECLLSILRTVKQATSSPCAFVVRRQATVVGHSG